MSIVVNVNGESINYPQTGDTNWGDEATDFAVQTSSALAKVGLSTGTTVDLPGTLDVTGNTTLDANLSVGGNVSVTGTTSLTGNVTLTNNLTVNGNTQLGNANTDTIGVTGIVNVDAGTLYVDPVNNRVGINKTSPAQALDVVGNVAVTGDVAINTNKFNITASSGNTSIAGTLGVTSDITTSGILTASNSTNVTTAPPITFTGDTNTGIGHSAADTLDYVTGGVSRSRLNSTGQQSSVVPDLSGSNTTLYNEYKCRAWVNFDGTTASPSTIRASGNVSSITKHATGDYTVNFTNALPDANYAIKCQTGLTTGARRIITQYGIDASSNAVNPTTTTVRIISFDESTTAMIDASSYSVAVFR